LKTETSSGQGNQTTDYTSLSYLDWACNNTLTSFNHLTKEHQWI